MFACTLFTCRSARAAEVWRTDATPEPVVVEASGFFKPYAAWLRMPDGLVDETHDLAHVVDETRALLPPALAAKIGTPPTIPAEIGLQTDTLRLQSVARYGEHVELDVAWQASLVVASSPLFAATTSSSTYLGAAQPTAARRLIDFDPVLLQSSSRSGALLLEHNLDQLALAYHGEAFSVVAGRQVVSWGTGLLWNPTDLFSPFAPTDVDREVRRGADAVRVSVPFGATTEIEALYLPQRVFGDNGGVLRARTNLLEFDISATIAKYVGDAVVGADFAGDVGPVQVHGEAAYTVPMTGLDAASSSSTVSLDVASSFLRAVAGVELRPSDKVFLAAEYDFNGFGTDDPTQYVSKLRSDRVARGEIFGAGRHYLGTTASWQVDDVTSIVGTAIVNVTDPSVLVAPSFERSFAQHVLLRAGASIPIGAGVDENAFHALTPIDLLTNDAAFKSATTSLGARSEFGLSPLALWAQLGFYFG